MHRKFHCLRAIMLLSDGYGGYGGISQFNREFLAAFDKTCLVERLIAVPRVIPNSVTEILPQTVIFDRKASGGKLAFLKRAAVRALRASDTNLVICGHINLLLPAFLIARARGARLTLIVHGIEAWQRSDDLSVNWLASKIDSFIAVSQHTAELFVKWSGVSPDRCTILSNCVDLARFRPEPPDQSLIDRYGVAGKQVLLTVGRLASRERYKGFDEVLAVLPELTKTFPNLVYLIVGEGPDRVRLEARAHELGMSDRVIFAGRVSEAEKVAHYNLADIYVMPSSGEGFGIVLIEAAACGLEVIGSKLDGSREALQDGKLGRLVDPREPTELISAITSVLKDTQAKIRREAVATFSTQNFEVRVSSWAQQQLEAIYGATVPASAPTQPGIITT